MVDGEVPAVEAVVDGVLESILNWICCEFRDFEDFEGCSVLCVFCNEFLEDRTGL